MSDKLIFDDTSKKEVQYDGYEELVSQAGEYSSYLPTEEEMAEQKLRSDMIQTFERDVDGEKEKYNGVKTLSYDDNKTPQVPQTPAELETLAKKMEAENAKLNEPLSIDDRGFWDKVTGEEKPEDMGMLDRANEYRKERYKDSVIDVMLEQGQITEEQAEAAKAGDDTAIEDLDKILDTIIESDNFPYLVRGADLTCNYGSHSRKLNLPKDHAVYITGEPLIHKLDCLPGDDKNITTFGVCDSPAADKYKPQPTVMLVQHYTDADGKAQTRNVKGPVCIPQIVGTWQNVFDEMRIVDNGMKAPLDKTKDMNDKNTGYSATTTNSFLVCRCQGCITPSTSGQKPPEEPMTSDGETGNAEY